VPFAEIFQKIIITTLKLNFFAIKVAPLVSSKKIIFLWPKQWRDSIRMHKLYWSILVPDQHLALWQCTMYCYTQLQQFFF